MEEIIETSAESTETSYPKTITYNKLNKLIIARRREIENNFQKDCPYCRGENPQCNYFIPFVAQTALSESSAETAAADSDQVVEDQTFLEGIRRALAGQVITVKAGLIEYDFDLGANLDLAKRYLDLYGSYPELPFLSDLGNRLGFYPKPLEDAVNEGLQPLMPFPSILIRSERIDFAELTDESRAEIVNWFRAVLNDLDQSDSEKLYLGLELVPLDPDADPWGTIGSGNKEEERAYFAEIFDVHSYLRLEKYIFQRLSNIEERILIQLEMRKPGEKEYPCSDLNRIHTEIRQELAELVESVRLKIAKGR